MSEEENQRRLRKRVIGRFTALTSDPSRFCSHDVSMLTSKQVYLGQHPLLDGGQSSCFVKGAVRSFNDLKQTDLQGALLCLWQTPPPF